MPDNNRSQPYPIIGGIYVFVNYIIAIITALFVILMFIGTIISKTTHWHLKTIHIQFLITALISCVYHLLNVTSVRCSIVLPIELFIAFPIVSQLTCLILFSYLMFKEELESKKAKIYVITFIFVNWIPAIGLAAVFKEKHFKEENFFCRFTGGIAFFRSFWIITLVFQVFFYILIYCLHKKLRELMSTHTDETEVLSKVYKKICVQFGYALFYTFVMWFYVFVKCDKISLGDAVYYLPGVLYNLSIPVLCIIFIWSANIRNSVSKIPFLRFLARQQVSSDENHVTLMG